VHVALYHVSNSLKLNTIITHTITNITLRRDALLVACLTSVLIHHINILAGTTMSSLQGTHRGMMAMCIRCIHPI